MSMHDVDQLYIVADVAYRVADGNVGRIEDGVPEVEWQPADAKDGPDPA